MKQNNGKYLFGMVKVGSKGQVVIPASARKIFNINSGDELLLLGDEEKGLAIVKPELTNDILSKIMGDDKNVGTN